MLKSEGVLFARPILTFFLNNRICAVFHGVIFLAHLLSFSPETYDDLATQTADY